MRVGECPKCGDNFVNCGCRRPPLKKLLELWSVSIGPCRLCGSEKTKLQNGKYQPSARYFRCEGCGMRTGQFLKMENLIANWNGTGTAPKEVE